MAYSLDDLLKDKLGKAKVPEKVEKIATYILDSEGATSPEKALKTPEIIDKFKKLGKTNPDLIEINEGSFQTTISLLASKSDSPIQCLGTGKGYFITLTTEDNDEVQSSKEAPKEKDKLQEKDLYPLLKQWLYVSLNVDNAVDISSRRANQKWRNPDVMGVKEIDFLGEEKFEIITIEAKLNKIEWTMYIFEAISHSMFSNKTYYAFLKDSFYEKISDEMKLYASRFGIGIISIAIDDKVRETIKDTDSLLKALNDGTCVITEEIPAPYHNPDMHLQKMFLNNLGVHTKKDLRDLSDE